MSVVGKWFAVTGFHLEPKRQLKMDAKYPDVVVQLTGEDGNAFAILGRVGRALREAGVSHEEIEAFYQEGWQQPSYDALLQFIMRTVEVE
jgi:hypothetical protein